MLRSRIGRAILYLIVLSAISWMAISYETNSRAAVDVGGELISTRLTFQVPKDNFPFEIGPPASESSVGLRLIGMAIMARGLAGFIWLSGHQMHVQPSYDLTLRPIEKSSFIDVATTGPLTVAVESPESKEIQLEPTILRGQEFGLGKSSLVVADLAPGGNTTLRGELHAQAIRIERLDNMRLADAQGRGSLVGRIARLELVSPSGQSRTGPIRFEGIPGFRGKLRLLFASDSEVSLGIRTKIHKVVSTDTGGKLTIGARSVSLTGFQTVSLSGSLEVHSVRITGDHVDFRISGRASYASVGGESVFPTFFERIVSEPYRSVLWGAVTLMFGGMFGAIGQELAKIIIERFAGKRSRG